MANFVITYVILYENIKISLFEILLNWNFQNNN